MGMGLLVGLLVPAMVAAGIGWGRVREIIGGGREPLLVAAAVGIWVTIWLGGLVLAGVGSAVRAAAFTLELPRAVGGDAPPGGSEDAVVASGDPASPS